MMSSRLASLGVAAALMLGLLSATPANAADVAPALAPTPSQGQPVASDTLGAPTKDLGEQPALRPDDLPGETPAPQDSGASLPAAPQNDPVFLGRPVPAVPTADELASRNVDGRLLAPGTYAVHALGKSLDVAGGSDADGANVQLWQDNGTAAQQWQVLVDAKGYVTLRNVRSGRCLDVTGGRARDGANVQQYGGNGTIAQSWVIDRTDAGLVLRPALDCGLALDVAGGSDADGANVQLWQDNGTPAQVWSFTLSDLGKAVARNEGGAILGSGTYVLTGEGSGKVVDVAAGSYEAGARVQTYERNGTGAQSWIATVDEQGYVTLCNAQSGKVLDVRHGIGCEGTPVQQYDPNGTGSQRWVALPCGAGLVSLRCALDLTLALDVRAGSLANGATLQLYAANGTQAQAWRLEAAPAAAIAPGWHRLAPLADLTRSLDVPGGSTSAAGLQLYAANGTQAQSWWVRHLGGSSYALQASCSGLYLTDDDGRRQAPDAGARSRWGVSYAPSGGYVLTNEATGARLDLGQGARWAALWATSGVRAGFYEVCLAANPSLRLDDEYASKTPGTRVQLWSGNGTLAQRWWLREAGGGALTLTNCNSGLALDARGANLGSGTDVRQWPRGGGATQRWLITMGASGLELRSAAEEAVLQACGETMSAGAGVRLFEPDGSVAQSWRLAAAPAPSKIGYQNPAGHYQVSSWNVVVPGGHGIFSYASPSVIGLEATREDCVDAFVRRAYDYLGTPYVWNYSCAPGVGVDCIGLVFQCAYATGMDLGSAVYESDFNPWSHVSSGPRGWHSHDANNFWNYARAQKVPYEDLRRGDVISYAGHAAIYVGGGKMIEAYSRATGVRLTAVRPGRGCIRLFS